MNKYAINESHQRVVVWIIWFIVIIAAIGAGVVGTTEPTTTPLLGVVSHDASKSGPLFPWHSWHRWKKGALQRYRKWRTRYRRAKRQVQLAKLALSGVMTMAQVVDCLTASQLHYKVGALPVLYALLQTLEVASLINRRCPTRGEVEHGTVALVLVLNRLLLPLPLYRISDWIGQTCLVATLGIEADKFNDDRLERTLDALHPHLDILWQEILENALVKAGIDLSVIFYDVTAVMAHGRYADSDFIDFGFAHNTPSNKRKFKVGLNATADGGLPGLYQLWSGSTADQATVQENLQRLAAWLHHHGYACQETLVVGDRAMMNAEIALRYEAHGLRHLTGLKASTKEQKQLLCQWSDEQIEAYPLEEGPSPQYWGRAGQVTFTSEGESVCNRALVVVSGPLRDQWRQNRQQHFEELFDELEALRVRIGQPYLRTLKSIERSVNARLKASKVGKFVDVTVYETAEGAPNLVWQINQAALATAERHDGRYLLVTNDWHLSHQEMFRLYREKDGVEKCFRVSKHDLQVSPLFLHKDERIASMLFINMVALLAYTLLQHQLQQQGVQMTTRRLIQRLDQLTLIETHCWDGSRLHRLTHIEPEMVVILQQVVVALDEMMQVLVKPEPGRRLFSDALAVQPRLLC
jgi:transposase